MKKTFILLLSIIFIFSLVFTGASCKKQVAKETAAGETTVEETAAEKKSFEGQTLIVRTGADILGKETKGLMEEFAKLNGITLDYTESGWDVYHTLGVQMLSTDQEVDMMDTINGFWNEFPDKHTPLQDLIPELLGDMIPEFVDYSTIKGNVVAMPFSPAYYIMWYNKEIFKNAGVEKVPETWTEFKDVIKKLNDFNGNYNFIVAWDLKNFPQYYPMFVRAAGGKIFDVKNGKLTFYYDSPEAIEALKFMKELIDEGLMPPGTLTEGEQETVAQFEKGELGIMMMWDNFAGWMKKEALDRSGYFALPGKEKGMTATIDGHEWWGIPAAAKNKELAVELLKFLASKEHMKQYSIDNIRMPIYKETAEDPEVASAIPFLEVDKVVMKNMASQFQPVMSSYELREFTAIEMHKALLGEISVEEACSNVQKFAEKMEPNELLITKDWEG